LPGTVKEKVHRKVLGCDFPVVATYGNTAYHLSKDFVRVKMVAVIAGKTHIFVGAFFDYCFVQEF
jgi:hypothetical protein